MVESRSLKETLTGGIEDAPDRFQYGHIRFLYHDVVILLDSLLSFHISHNTKVA